MESREIKFRAFSTIGKHRMIYLKNGSLKDLQETDNWNVMQFTGLKDKKGVNIYESDIFSKKWKCEVYKDDKTGAYMVKFHTSPNVNKPKTLYQWLKDRKKAGTDDDDCIVIGNIYENPELLT
jgi:uncharacterized phage protein (TIGR01671 family)